MIKKQKSIFGYISILVLLLMLLCGNVNSRQRYIYIQSEDHKAFYVKNGSDVYNSSANGYLLMEGLGPITYELVLGFVNNGKTEWSFNCSLEKADLGYVLKKKGDTPLLSVIGNGEQITGVRKQNGDKKDKAEVPGPVSEDAFSNMLAVVVNDPTIRYKPVLIEKKTVAVNEQPAADTPIIVSATAPVTVPEAVLATETKKPEEAAIVSTITEPASLPEVKPLANETELDKKPKTAVTNVVVKDVEEKKPDDVVEKPVLSSEEIALKEEIKNDKKPKKKEETPRAAVVSIKKTLQKSTADGIELIYIDEIEPGVKDTIRILIPAEKR